MTPRPSSKSARARRAKREFVGWRYTVEVFVSKEAPHLGQVATVDYIGRDGEGLCRAIIEGLTMATPVYREIARPTRRKGSR